MRPRANASSLLATLLLLSGCATIPDLGNASEPKAAGSYASEESFGDSSLSDWPSSIWWEGYRDDQLAQLINEALANAPSITEADGRVRQAEAIAQQEGAILYPNISANGSYEKVRQSYNQGFPPGAIPTGFSDVASATLNLNVQIDFWGKNHALLAAATSEAVAARLESLDARLIVSTSVAGVYADLAQLYANLDAAKDALDVRAESAVLIKRRQDSGLENKGSYEQEVAAKASAEAEIEALNEAIALTKNKLTALMGMGPDRAITISRPDIHSLKPFGLPADLPADFLGHRPDVMAARLQAEAISHQVKAAKASFYPNINLIGLAGHRALGLSTFTSPNSLYAAIGPAVSLPILDGGALQGEYRRERAGYDIAVSAYNAALLQALHDVADVVTSEKMLSPRLRKTEAAVKASEEAYQVINNRYKSGLAAYLAVLRAEDALIANRRALIDLRTRAFTLDVALIRALGGGFTSKQGS